MGLRGSHSSILRTLNVKQEQYKKAFNVFDIIKDVSNGAMFQLSVILYDDLLDRVVSSTMIMPIGLYL
jgi:hypothetical protein